ncbi:MAG: hypothetical protein ACTSUE_24065 [Promethearchaeota archaeon]
MLKRAFSIEKEEEILKITIFKEERAGFISTLFISFFLIIIGIILGIFYPKLKILGFIFLMLSLFFFILAFINLEIRTVIVDKSIGMVKVFDDYRIFKKSKKIKIEEIEQIEPGSKYYSSINIDLLMKERKKETIYPSCLSKSSTRGLESYILGTSKLY